MAKKRATDSRRHGRVRTELLLCAPLGQVLDLSVGGVRVLVRGSRELEPTRTLEARLRFGEMEVPVTLRVHWAQRVGFRRRVAGLSFVAPSPLTIANIQMLARAAILSPYAYRPLAA